MKIHCGVPGSDRLPAAYCRAVNIRRDLGRAVGLYAIGDRSEIVLRTLAAGRVVYAAIGASVPVPIGVDPEIWRTVLDTLVRRYGVRPYEDVSNAA